jgi:hypothetical protein
MKVRVTPAQPATTNWMIVRMRKTTAPTTKSPKAQMGMHSVQHHEQHADAQGDVEREQHGVRCPSW